MRLLFTVWLAAFALQSADVFALVVPDGCVDAGQPESTGDPCPDQGCARCVCCARLPGFVISSVVLVADTSEVAPAPTLILPFTSASPHRILHVPKAL